MVDLFPKAAMGRGRNLQTWRTPPHLYAKLDAEFHFDTDPCPPNPQMDGLCMKWGRSVFLNPPYGNITPWVARAVGAARDGSTVVGLLPARTDTAWFHDHVLAEGAEVRWVRGRLHFLEEGKNKHAPFPSMIVIWRPR